MKFYLDDDMDSNEIIGLLEHEGYEVISPRRVAMRGAQDKAHLNYAAAEQCVWLTANVRDFLMLHQRGQEDEQSHAGPSTGRTIPGAT
jgi:Domain of unknown function (DUF5615)